MASLDNSAALGRGNVGVMLRNLETYVADFSVAYKNAADGAFTAPRDLSRVLIAGMGGSGISGDLVVELLRDEAPVPLLLRKGYGAPKYVDRNTLVVAVSYSGETEETLDVALASKERGATLVGVSTGGRLERIARGPRSLHVPVPTGRQPREALPALFGTVLGIHASAGLTKQALSSAAKTQLKEARRALAPPWAEKDNAAKRAARSLHDKFPYWYGGPGLSAVALRARCQLNENAKMLARNDELPEANHNETVAWNGLEKKLGRNFHATFLRTPGEPPEIRSRFEFVADVLASRDVSRLDFVASGGSTLERILHALMFVDYTSVYAASLRGVDPIEVRVITQLKDALATGGKAPELHRRIG